MAAQNPMDLHYRALSNAGIWCIERLQADADRVRVIDGLAGARPKEKESAAELGRTLQRLAPRWFVVKNAHAPTGEPVLLRPRYDSPASALNRAANWIYQPVVLEGLRKLDRDVAAGGPSQSTPPHVDFPAARAISKLIRTIRNLEAERTRLTAITEPAPCPSNSGDGTRSGFAGSA